LVGWSPAAGTTDPNIMYNNTGSIVNSWGIEWAVGELSLGPHFSGAPSTKGTGVRWTAPAAGDYAVDMTFTLNQGDIPQPVKVYHNGTLLLDGDTGTGLGSSVNYTNATLSVAVGDTIDLIAAGTPYENIALAGTISDGSTTWDVADDFSWENNPNGDWAYGYHAGTLPGPVVYGFQQFNGLAADHPVIGPTGLIGLTVDSTTDPNILYNATDAVIESWGITWEPGDLTLGPHPGASGSIGSSVRWTAPADGNYSIDASFILAQLDDSQPVYIYHNDVQLFADGTGGPNGSSTDYSNLSLSMTAGDTIDFIVEAGLGRTVQLEATISDSGAPLPGDADNNGVVNDLDAAILAGNWQMGGASWGDGDFNGDTVVDDIDATILATNWQTSSSASVPEPGCLALLLAGLVSLAVWRRMK